jgi:hypothetical protein
VDEPKQRLARWCLSWLGASFGLLLMSALASVPIPVQLGFALAFGAVAAEILLVASFAPVLRPRALLACGALCGTGILALAGAAPTALAAAFLTACLLAGTTLLGVSLGARIERPGHLLAVASISALADIWSVFDAHGPTSQLVEDALSAPERLALFALPWPLLGAGRIEPLIGAGDAAFAALYLGAFERHGLATARVRLGLGLGFAVGLALLLTLERAVPLLPLLGLGVVLSDRRARALEARELRTVLVVVVSLLGLLWARLGG